ncbi:DUF58 domain-containing protein [Anaerosporobacter sp.]
MALGWKVYFKKNWDKNIVVYMNFLQNYVYEGEQTQLIEKIENRKRIPIPVLEVYFRLRRELSFRDMENIQISDFTYRRDIFSMLGNQRITRRLTIDCMKRGYYEISKMNYKAYSLLYRDMYIREKPVNTNIYVYAKRTDVSNILLASAKIMGTLQCARQIYDDPFAFNSIREYTITDPLKTINWKSSAKTGNLMVNTFESTITESIMIYLDVEDIGIYQYDPLIEEGICVAATLTDKLINKGMEVGLCVNMKEKEKKETIRIEPEGGTNQLHKIERVLSLLSAEEEVVSFEEILNNPPKDAIVIVISKNVSKYQQMLESFVGKEKQGIWVVPFSKEEVCKADTPGNLHVVKREVTCS